MARLMGRSKALTGMSVAVCLLGGAFAFAQSGEDAAPALDLRPEDAPMACDETRPQIRVTVTGHTDEGIVLVELYNDDAKNFLEREARLGRTRVPAAAVPEMICFDIDGPGVYAVAGYHDINGDRRLDKKWNRLPKEPFGLSNDPDLKLRKPRLYEAAFEVVGDRTDIPLKLRRR